MYPHVCLCLLCVYFFSVCLLVFEGEGTTPNICDNCSSKFNHMLPYFCSGWMKQIFIYPLLVHEVRPAGNLASLLSFVYSSVLQSFQSCQCSLLTDVGKNVHLRKYHNFKTESLTYLWASALVHQWRALSNSTFLVVATWNYTYIGITFLLES